MWRGGRCLLLQPPTQLFHVSPSCVTLTDEMTAAIVRAMAAQRYRDITSDEVVGWFRDCNHGWLILTVGIKTAQSNTGVGWFLWLPSQIRLFWLLYLVRRQISDDGSYGAHPNINLFYLLDPLVPGLRVLGVSPSSHVGWVFRTHIHRPGIKPTTFLQQ